MNKLILAFLFVCFSKNYVHAQNTSCAAKIDSNTVIKIAKKQNAYWTEDWLYMPKLNFNDTTCEWTVQSGKVRHTTKGDCKHTNGCTETTFVTLVIDGTTKKVKSRTKKIVLLPNYE